MSDLRTAALRALEALEWNLAVIEDFGDEEQLHRQHKAITALRAALAEPQEPAIPWGKAIGVEQKRGCRVCGIGADGKAYGYVCPRSDCPTRVTCGGAA